MNRLQASFTSKYFSDSSSSVSVRYFNNVESLPSTREDYFEAAHTRIVFFGTGMGGKRGYRWARGIWPIVAFVDNNQSLWNSNFCKTPVMSPSELKNIQFERIVIASETYAGEMERQLKSLGVPDSKVWRLVQREPPPIMPLLPILLNPLCSLGSLLKMGMNVFSKYFPKENRKKTIVVAIKQVLWPIDGGGVSRTLSLIGYLRSEGYRVVLVVPHTSFICIRALARYVDRVWTDCGKVEDGWPSYCLHKMSYAHRVITNRRNFGNLTMKAVYLKKQTPTSEISFFEKRRSARFERLVINVCYKENVHALIAVYAYLAPILEKLPENVLKIIDTIDVQYTRQARAQAVGESLREFSPPPSKDEESRLLRISDAVIAIQAQEKEELQRMVPDLPVLLVGHANRVIHSDTPTYSKAILFIGSYYVPNIHGISYFIKNIWPQIQNACQEATLDICGNVCEALSEYAAIKGITLRGRVSSLASYYKKAAVVVNPVQFGSGLKIKAIEALAHGKCLIATEQGILGLPSSVKGAACIVTLGNMAATVSEMLANPIKRKDIEQKALRFAEHHFSQDLVYYDLGTYLKSKLK